MTLDPRTVTDPIQFGSRLRDAAVDPQPGDFLTPTNAGAEGELGNPHGPSVVFPEIHGSQGVRPILAGAVSSTAATQDTAEKAHVATWHPDTVPPEPEV